MATMAQRIKAFLNSPTGKRVIEKGRQELSKPENQRKLRQLAGRLQKRR
jgi:hypothetical protein